MSAKKFILLAAVLLLVGATAWGLARLQREQRLGAAGVKTVARAGGGAEIYLPAEVAGFTSEVIETPKVVADLLPKDTTFGQRLYRGADGFQAQLNVVLMGADRSSIHKPQICLPAQGWRIDRTEVRSVPVARPERYDLGVIKLEAANQVMMNGQAVPARGIYVYWFVTDGELSADPSGWRRLWRSMGHLLRTGELQRWAYVSVFAVCAPGQEGATFARMEELIAATVPEFQLAVARRP